MGCELPPELAGEAGGGGSSSESSLSDVDVDTQHLFDPEDVDPHIFAAKKDAHGIGYRLRKPMPACCQLVACCS